MDSVMRAAIGGQFGAAINTLREARARVSREM